VADVDGPIEREANFFEHRARHPDVAAPAPEDRMLDAGRFFPCPIFVVPECAMLIAAGLDESQEIGVGNVVALDGKSGNADDTLAALVVPAECFAVRFAEAESGFAFGYFNEVGFEGAAVCTKRHRLYDFAVVRKAMEQVGERFRVHEAVLDCGFEHFQKLWVALAGMFERGVDGRIHFFAKAGVVMVDFAARGPVERAIIREASTDWVNAEGEEVIERRIEGAQTEGSTAEEVPVERLDVAQIKNEAMAFGYGAVVDGVFTDERKNFVGTSARMDEPGLKIIADANCGGRCHWFSPSVGCRRREKDAPEFRRREG